ncbi:helix-turn-helix domain-containing protein [Streptomyces sp. SID5473]|nr:helix-turn-helix domain-containing protein [Streptomyces sp. SID5473]MYS68311.1 helix-turn-helix domain-containing protein [Streptomyces sp. SID5473]
MTHETGADRPGVHGRRGCTAAGGRGTLRARRFADLVRGRREELGLSVADVAARLEISTRTYGSWERTPAHEWSEERLHALVKALEMTDQQGGWLFRLAVDREMPAPVHAPPARKKDVLPLGPARPSGAAFPRRTPVGPLLPFPPSTTSLPKAAAPAPPSDPATQAYLRDYAVMMDAVPLPSVLFDRRWDVAHANPAYQELFRDVSLHPTAMPDQNFLRFVLFHPDAGAVLGDRETGWCLPLLAQLETALERYADDSVLQAIRQEIEDDPIMDAAYRCGLPHWVRATGAAAVHHDGAVRTVYHPDPRWGRAECRIVDETPATLEDCGFTRMTMVLRGERAPTPGAPEARRRATRLAS